MVEIDKLSEKYMVRRLSEADAEEIYELCQSNTLFYRYCEAELSREQIYRDLHITPPGISEERKHYVGFYSGGVLIAVMDLIDGFPEEENAFIGFFMVKASVQKQGVGSGIIRETSEYLEKIGKTSIQLGIDKANPQSTSFWKKNNFQVIKEIEKDRDSILLAEKTL